VDAGQNKEGGVKREAGERRLREEDKKGEGGQWKRIKVDQDEAEVRGPKEDRKRR